MLTKADDYPIHQTPDPIAYAQSDRNFYDRYFFHGYSVDGEIFFGAALGVYPNLNIMDAAFAVRIGQRQYNIRASRHLNMERMDTKVGPIRVEVLQPLHALRIVVEDNEHGISADIVFTGRSPPIEEPRTTRRNGPRITMDVTRMTQLGRYEGRLHAGGHEFTLDSRTFLGVRDRSWGVRQVGLQDPQPMVPEQDNQFHWNWIPVHFEDCGILFYLNEDRDGAAWNRGMVVAYDDGRVDHLPGAKIAVTCQPGTRWPTRAAIALPNGTRIDLVAQERFFMTGIGYMDPKWVHGMNKGPLVVGYDEIDTATVPYQPPYVYSQAFVDAIMTRPNHTAERGYGAFEALSMGPHAGLGYKGLHDG